MLNCISSFFSAADAIFPPNFTFEYNKSSVVLNAGFPLKTPDESKEISMHLQNAISWGVAFVEFSIEISRRATTNNLILLDVVCSGDGNQINKITNALNSDVSLKHFGEPDIVTAACVLCHSSWSGATE